MMSSLDKYDKLKGELNRIFVEGFDVNEDGFLRSLLSSAKASDGALSLAGKLKEDGNSLFKQKEFDDALEHYGYAEVVLACCNFERDEDRVAFSDLAISILLNTTACLSKKREFVKVGQLCSVVLDFKPNSVKALFRRAVAAMELGKPEWGYWDLWAAMEVEPKNLEVIRKFEEVKGILDIEKPTNHSQDFTPIGLGFGLSPPKKNDSKCLDEVSNKSQCEVHVTVSTANKRKGEWQTEESSISKKEKQDLGVKEGIKVKVRDSSCLQGGMNISEEKMKEGNLGISNSKNSFQAEPMYRFENRRRPGSSITISGKNYDLLKKGKTIKFFKPSCGTLMTIQVKAPKGDIGKKDAIPGDEMNVLGQVDQKENEVDIVTTMGEMEKDKLDSNASSSSRDGRELLTASRKVETSAAEAAPNKSEHPSFQCSAEVENEGRGIYDARVKRKPPQRKPRDHFSKKRISPTAPCSSLCSVGFCRPRLGTKRKRCAIQDPVQQHPRKKLSTKNCNSVNLVCFPCNGFISCSSELDYGRYVNASHAMVSNHEVG